MTTLARVQHRPSATRPAGRLSLRAPVRAARAQRRSSVAPQAMLGGGDDKGDKVTLSREEEPDEYWASEGERKGGNPFKDPLAIIGIAAILFPFFLVLVAISTGLIDVSVYK